MDIIGVITAFGALANVIIAVVFGFLAIRISREQTRLVQEQTKLSEYQHKTQEKELSLTTLRAGVDALLNMKSTFADRADIFDAQISQAPDIRTYLPPHMDVRTFMTFAAGMWELSYVYSVLKRSEENGLLSGEVEGLRAELFLWLRYVPGFYDVYCYHTSQLRAHNPDFLAFLETEVYNEEYRRNRLQGPQIAA